MCTHAHAHACTRTHARTHTHTHARTHGNGGGGGHGGGSGSGGYGGRGGGSASQIITWHRATISQRGFPHVAQATVSIRGFPRVLFTGLLRPPAMPEDDGGRPSPPDIGEATLHVCKLHAACTRARNLPDKWGEPQNSPVLDHNEQVRHENSKSISKSSDPAF